MINKINRKGKYTIKMIRGYGSLTEQILTLNKDNVFVIATKTPKTFSSPKEASKFYMDNTDLYYYVNGEKTLAIGTGFYIKGPKGGSYSITKGDRLR